MPENHYHVTHYHRDTHYHFYAPGDFSHDEVELDDMEMDDMDVEDVHSVIVRRNNEMEERGVDYVDVDTEDEDSVL